MTLAFLLTSLIVVVTPAAGALYSVSHSVIRRPRVVAWMRRTFAATYVALAARMAVTAR